MTEWLTTGQMIGQIKTGDRVERKSDGAVLVLSNHYYGLKHEDSTDTLSLTLPNLNSEWRILPKYVSFEEAMKALKEGKDAWCHPNWGSHKHKIVSNEAVNYSIEFLSIKGEGLLGIVFDSKWTIEEKKDNA